MRLRRGLSLSLSLLDDWTLAVSNSSGVVVSDVSIFSASGMAIVELDGACGHTYRRVRVVPRGATRRLHDRLEPGHPPQRGLRARATRGGQHRPLVEDSTFSRGCDDYINIHTTIQTLHHSASAGLIVVSPRIVTTDPGRRTLQTGGTAARRRWPT